MRERFSDRERAFSVGGEFGPVVGDRRVVVELAALHERGDHQRSDRLGGGINRAEGGVGPWLLARAISEAATQVDDQFVASKGGKRRAMFKAFSKVLLEGLADGFEASGGETCDAHARDIGRETLRVNRAWVQLGRVEDRTWK